MSVLDVRRRRPARPARATRGDSRRGFECMCSWKDKLSNASDVSASPGSRAAPPYLANHLASLQRRPAERKGGHRLAELWERRENVCCIYEIPLPGCTITKPDAFHGNCTQCLASAAASSAADSGACTFHTHLLPARVRRQRSRSLI